MIKYNEFINENNNIEYELICNINKEYLIKISGQNTLEDAIKNELKSINNITFINVVQIGNDYKILINVDNDIMETTDMKNIEDSIEYEFSWLNQSGIKIKNINIA
jgi:hypothetical protein